jgi:hypothetical protein
MARMIYKVLTNQKYNGKMIERNSFLSVPFETKEIQRRCIRGWLRPLSSLEKPAPERVVETVVETAEEEKKPGNEVIKTAKEFIGNAKRIVINKRIRG